METSVGLVPSYKPGAGAQARAIASEVVGSGQIPAIRNYF